MKNNHSANKIKFSIGYNHDIESLTLLEKYKDNIEAIYFPIPSRYMGSGRDILQGEKYINEIPEIIKKCKTLNIGSELLMNATCEGATSFKESFSPEFFDYLRKLKDLGLASIIVTNPTHISKIRKQIKDIMIESSVNCYVKTVEHALYLRDLGVDILTIDRDINRDIPLIKQIKERTRLKIKIMLNEGCLRNCPFRNIHYNYLSHPVEKSDFQKRLFFDNPCFSIYSKNPLKIFSIPFVTPNAIEHYNNIVDYYKLSTRVFTTSRIESCLKAYINRKFSGNLLDILDSPGLSYFTFINYAAVKNNGYFENMFKCSNNCADCDFCNKLFKEAVVINTSLLDNDKREEHGKKAIKMFRKLLKDFPNEPAIYLGWAKTYFRLQRYKEALEKLNKILAFDFIDDSVYYFLGVCYLKIGKFEKALASLKKLKGEMVKGARVNLLLSECYRNMGLDKESFRELNEGMQKLRAIGAMSLKNKKQ